jgi:hypothetical protein
MNEPTQVRPILFVQAGNVFSIDVGEVVLRHGRRAFLITWSGGV